jgi:serine/threonine-protein kinase RsbW
LPPVDPPGQDGAHLAVASTLDGLKEGSAALDAWLKRIGAGQDAENRAQLVFDEIVTNIIRYAFDDKAEHRIGLSFTVSGDALMLGFEDDGRDFDPRCVPEIIHASSLDKATIGGRGLHLVRKAARKVEYERTESGRNRLTVILAKG